MTHEWHTGWQARTPNREPTDRERYRHESERDETTFLVNARSTIPKTSLQGVSFEQSERQQLL
jgi:hypothetical protein